MEDAHTVEELKDAALAVLSGREKVHWERISQYSELERAAAEVLARREDRLMDWQQARLTRPDQVRFFDAFGDMLTQGLIVLGKDVANPRFPWFRLSPMGRRILEYGSLYFFYDVDSYEKTIKDQIPSIDDVTLLYLKEAMQAFRVGCLLSGTVMVGVAAEHTFLLLLEVVETSPHAAKFRAVRKDRRLLRMVNRFWEVLSQHLAPLPGSLKEGLETEFLGIQNLLRQSRNEAGHPSGTVPGREQVYILLNLFMPYCKKMYQLMDYFRPATAAGGSARRP